MFSIVKSTFFTSKPDTKPIKYNDDEWTFIKYTSIAEPFWGKTINK